MKQSSKFVSINLILLICSCGVEPIAETPEASESNPTSEKNFLNENGNNSDSAQFFYNDRGRTNNLNFESLLNNSFTESVGSNIKEDLNENSAGNITSIKDSVEIESFQNLKVETALKNLEDGALKRQKSVDELRKINFTKDQTISTMSKINKELINEIKRLKSMKSISLLDENHLSKSSLDSLKAEVYKLKNNIILKSRELDNLRLRNNSLEEKIVGFEQVPFSRSNNFPSVILSDSNNHSAIILNNADSGANKVSLSFEAVVTALNGKSKEAFYTEFFILNNDLESILIKGGINLQDYPSISTYGELWAKSRKNSFLFPGVQKNIRSMLLDLIEKGDGRRVRTDVDGAANILDIKEGRYFIIGTASLGKVGVTWSVPISLTLGNNKISLTLANCSWSL